MPEAVTFHHENKIYTVSFKDKNAALPVKLKNGQHLLVPWGRRSAENSELPLGGWARLDSIKNHNRWDRYLPKPVQLPIEKFMEKDHEGHTCWYEVTKGQCLQGLFAREENECRVYIVTIEPEDFMNSHSRWPHIVTNYSKR